MSLSTKGPFRPTLTRLAWGVVVGAGVPLVAASVLFMAGAGFGGGVLFMIYAGAYALGASVVFGLPAIWLMRGRDPSVGMTALLGACVASAPCVARAAFADPGVSTLLIVTVPLGALGGMVFGAVALVRPPPPGRGASGVVMSDEGDRA